MKIAAEVRPGNALDAITASLRANAEHGWRRSNDDKRRAVRTLLNDPEWAQWSDREISRRCGVSDRLVNGLRPVTAKLSQLDQQQSTVRTYTDKHGNTSSRGRRRKGAASGVHPTNGTPSRAKKRQYRP